MDNWATNGHRRSYTEQGFTFIELLMTTVLLVVFTGISIPICTRTVAYAQLWSTTAALMNHLHYAQSLAQVTGRYAELRLSVYIPQYQVFSGTTQIGRYAFAPGVGYKDGYLQMTSGSVLYDVYGNAQVAGRLRLTDMAGEADINLYMGAGWQTTGG